LANPDGGFLAPSAVVKRPAVIDFDEIYLKISLTPMFLGEQALRRTGSHFIIYSANQLFNQSTI
jgi:hypothetical protein